MNKFVLLSFGFMGWAFYEMSGGADFEPASERLARLAPAAEETQEPLAVAAATTSGEESATPQPAPQPKTQWAEVIDTEPELRPLTPEVTRAFLSLTDLSDVAATSDGQARVTQAAAGGAADPYGVPRNVSSVTASGDTPPIMPSLIVGMAPIAASAPAETTTMEQLDLRTVSGSRVNVRGGPGTNFQVVGGLVEGDRVEVLEDDGSGWVRMRAVDSSEEGWMADFLLEAS